jgi:heavy metal sensor kinase
MSRLPLRIRLTLPFALAMAIVLTALGGFVYLRVGSALLQSTDQTLFAQATEATLRVENGRALVDRDATGGAATVTEVISADHTIVTSVPLGLPPLLASVEASRVLAGHALNETTLIPGHRGRWRLLAISVMTRHRRVVLVLGGSLRDRDETLGRLRHELLFSSPLALLVATLAGYLLAGAALRPVEAMRRKAEAISAATPGSRLPVPRSRDEIARLADTLNEMLARLETAFQHERRFIAEASHELRTPLALLRTELDLALRKPRSTEELEAALHSAAEETDRLISLASDLLLIARSEETAIPIHLETISAHALLATVAGRFSARAGEDGRDVELSLGADVAFEGDAKRIEQALGNLVDNALLHGAGTVTLSARRVNSRVELHVTDDGPGFPVEFVARAFDRFSRAADARRRSGSGLGLAIVRTIATAHDGDAAASNTQPRGADVWLSLPLNASPTGEDHRPRVTFLLRHASQSTKTPGGPEL